MTSYYYTIDQARSVNEQQLTYFLIVFVHFHHLFHREVLTSSHCNQGPNAHHIILCNTGVWP